MPTDENPLRDRLAAELADSEWLQAFKAINQLLHGLKQEIPDIQQCDLKWDTASQGLTIHCPSAALHDRLYHQRDRILAIAAYARHITLATAADRRTVLKQ